MTSVLSRVRMAPSPGVSAGTLETSGSRSSRWLDFWINVQHPRAVFFAYLVAAVEILIAIALITGFARKLTYLSAAVFSVLIWATAEGFGGPYTSGSADIGTALIYAVVVAGLLALSYYSEPSRYTADYYLEQKYPWWWRLAEVRRPGQPRRSSGSGIGLTIARDIARAHGGEVTASSPGPGRGATFVLMFPLRTSAPAWRS